MKRVTSICLILTLGIAQLAMAQFTGSTYDGTYYDASIDNTLATDGTVQWYYNDVEGDEEGPLMWRIRDGYGQGIIEADGSGNDAVRYGDKPEIYTTISGLIPGVTYQIGVVFWATGDDWRVRAGLVSGELTEYLPSGAVATGGVESNRNEYAATIGSMMADASGEIKVYVDDNDPEVSADDQSRRTWYDGLVYKMIGSSTSPSPVDEATGVAIEEVTLSWLAGRNIAGTAINPDIYKHYLAYSAQEPNFISPIEVTELSDDLISYTLTEDLMANSTYYWCVYTVVGGDYDFEDPNTLAGPVWSFETIKTLPDFDLGTQPVDVLGEAGTAVSLTAEAFVQSGTSEISHQWYKGLPTDETPEELAGETATVLSIALVADGSADGYYFCRATNDNGFDDSEAAYVQAKRIIGSFAFDNDLTDATGGAGVAMDPAVYSVDVPYDSSSASLSFDGASAATIDAAYMATKDITISAWFKYSSSSSWQRIYDFGNGTGEYIFLSPTNGSNMRFAIKTTAVGSEQGIVGAVPAINQWNHVVVTISGDTGVMYLNGLQAAENTEMTSDPIDVNCSVSYLGDSQWDGDPFLSGLIDDLVVYNYALTAIEVADLYTTSADTYICVEEVEFDIAGPGGAGDSDCKVDMLDFAVIAQSWLECGLYPESACN